MNSYIIQPTLIPEDRILHAIRILTCDLNDAPTVCAEAQLQAITDLHDVLEK